MKWIKIDLIKMEQTGTDELENPINEPVVYERIKARVSPWTSDDLRLEERTITKTCRKMITPASYNTIKFAEKVGIDGISYNLVGMRKLGRMRALIVEGYHG